MLPWTELWLFLRALPNHSPMMESRTLPTRCMISPLSTVPSCRTPHLWLKEHRSLYDALGADYALVRISGIEAAACRGVPFAVIDVDTPDARALYTRNLTLIRPDHHVAWRSDEEPAAPLDLMDLVRGARPISTETPG
jgi:hypothetical protein